MSAADPPRTLRFGIMGAARIAAKVARAVEAVDLAEVGAVASRSAERADRWAAEHGVQQSRAGYQSLLDDDQLDAIYIPLPPALHAEWTIRCAEAGKHVLCEKPLATSAAQAREMADACRRNNVQLMDATMWLHHPRTLEMSRLIQGGALGELRRLTAGLGLMIDEYVRQKPAYAARDSQTGRAAPEKATQYEYRLQRELGGGALLDIGWYGVRAAIWAFDSLPRQVFAAARYRRDVDMNISALMWFDDDRMASFDCGYDVAPRKWMEVVGTRGSLVCDDFLGPWDDRRPRYWLHDSPGRAEERGSAPRIQQECMIENFCRIVRSGKLDESWPAAAIDAQRICDALDASARTSRIVTLD